MAKETDTDIVTKAYNMTYDVTSSGNAFQIRDRLVLHINDYIKQRNRSRIPILYNNMFDLALNDKSSKVRLEATKYLLNRAGEKPVDKQEIDLKEDIDYDKMTDEELDQLLEQELEGEYVKIKHTKGEEKTE